MEKTYWVQDHRWTRLRAAASHVRGADVDGNGRE